MLPCHLSVPDSPAQPSPSPKGYCKPSAGTAGHLLTSIGYLSWAAPGALYIALYKTSPSRDFPKLGFIALLPGMLLLTDFTGGGPG